jgi:trehalose utilization protein
VRALVWDEHAGHVPQEIYPHGINGAIADGLNADSGGAITARTANLDEWYQGITDEALGETDVLLWWAHARHQEVSDDTARRIHYHVHERGMGFIALHSAHYSKPFQWVVQCPGHLKGGWREAEPPDTEEITVCAPRHPIAAGVRDFILPQEEMYGAPFDTPPPVCLVLQSYFPLGGEYFPSGICWTVGEGKTPGFQSGPGNGVGEGEGKGRVFYFRPGHEAFPTYFNDNVRLVLKNAVLWCARRV